MNILIFNWLRNNNKKRVLLYVYSGGSAVSQKFCLFFWIPFGSSKNILCFLFVLGSRSSSLILQEIKMKAAVYIEPKNVLSMGKRSRTLISWLTQEKQCLSNYSSDSFSPLASVFPFPNEVENVMSLTTNETAFIFVSSGFHLWECASEVQWDEQWSPSLRFSHWNANFWCLIMAGMHYGAQCICIIW